MGMTITEKILAAHAGREKVTPGENIWCDVDVLMTHDICVHSFCPDFQLLYPRGTKGIPCR